MTQRLDRNGLPILDPPQQANKLSRTCPPTDHEFVRMGQAFAGQNWAMDLDYYTVEYRCRKCGLKDFEDEAYDTRERKVVRRWKG